MMKAVSWHGKRDVRVDTVPDPAIHEPTDAIGYDIFQKEADQAVKVLLHP